MKVGHVIGATVLLTPVLFVGMTEPASARNTHTVTIQGVLNVRDAGGQVSGDAFTEPINLTHDSPTGSFRVERCAGGQTRGVLSVTVRLNSTETVSPSAVLYLYEGTDCKSNDLEGTARTRATDGPLLMGRIRDRELSVKNGEFLSDDSAHAELSIEHAAGADVGRPREPSDVVATAIPGTGEKAVRVDWSDNASNETGYEIRNTTLNQSFLVDANATSFSLPHLNDKIRHCVQVRAVGVQGRSAWTPVGERVECA
ncbi:fibronectin type III domain-containing protein [Streptomyces sp. NPDC059985]|uniref:fibronectin type III domain-containing protein n=1 Tax=Streptomyces sp. NPDC059985 TaxID=3347025 RepID=UPI0036AF293A